MDDRNIENDLSRFRLKNPKPELRDKVLSKARTAWSQKPDNILQLPRPIFTLTRCACAVAALFLAAYVVGNVDTMLTYRLVASTSVSPAIAMDPEMEQLLVESGRDPKIYRQLILFSRSVSMPSDHLDLQGMRQRLDWMKEFLTNNGGVS